MTRKAAVAAVSLLMMTSSLAYAAETSSTVGMHGPSAADLKSLTDMRVGLVKAALQLTPDQEQMWPAVEEAIRARSKNRMARLEKLAGLHDHGAIESMGDRNLVDVMQSRADMLIQRGSDLKKVADAWQPLYKTLSADQKKRLAFVTFVAVRGMRDAIEHRNDVDHHDDSEEDDD